MGMKLTPETVVQQILDKYGITSYPAMSLDKIAVAEDIRVKKKSYKQERSDDFCGGLFYRGNKKVIIINTVLGNAGRNNFTFAHELGHYFLNHQGESFKCSTADIHTDNIKYRPLEVEANQFAVEFLMPPQLFRSMMLGSSVDFTLIDHLHREFMVSKAACANRILDFTNEKYMIFRTEGLRIIRVKRSKSLCRNLITDTVPQGVAAYTAITQKKNQSNFTESDAVFWFGYINKLYKPKVYECTRGDFDHGIAMTILKVET